MIAKLMEKPPLCECGCPAGDWDKYRLGWFCVCCGGFQPLKDSK